MFYPPRIDETGKEVPSTVPNPYVVTATDTKGHYDGGGDCGGYTGAGTVDGGWAYSAYPLFTAGIGNDCSSSNTWRLYCLEVDWYSPLAFDIPSGMRLAFVTQGALDGAQGVVGFDNMCAAEALDAGLPGQFEAFVETTDASAPSRFAADGGAWRRPDGVVLTKDAQSLLSLTLVPQATLQQHADGTYDTRYIGDVWTGIGGTNCLGWTTNDGGVSGAVGISDDTTYEFGGAYPPACKYQEPVYCLQR
jgi:hypothetical protein